jgi:hypothetical protein
MNIYGRAKMAFSIIFPKPLLAFYVATVVNRKKVVQQLTVFTSVTGLHTKI